MNKFFKPLVAPLLSVAFALLIGSLVLIMSGLNPLVAYKALLYGAFGNLPYFGDTLSRATPIIFTGLAVGFAFKGGLFNIGAEGQLLIGAMAAAVAGYVFKDLPMIIHLPLTILISVFFSGLWGFIPGMLRAFKGVHEVIATIMLNYIALNIGGYLIELLRVGELAQTPEVLQSATYPKISTFIPAFEGSNVNIGFIFAIIAACIMNFVLYKTVLGYEVTSMGLNDSASEDAGIGIKKRVVLIMVISAVLSGLGGAERVLGVHRAYLSGISTNFGFEGIAVTLLANNNPIGIIFSAILFGALASGGQYMNLAADVPIDIIGIIQGLIILFAASKKAFEVFYIKKKSKKSKEVVA